jgi:hypothetical protein
LTAAGDFLPRTAAVDLEINERGELYAIGAVLGERSFARLSRAAGAEWGQRLEAIRELRVLAMVWRSRNDGDERCRADYRCEAWEVPVGEVVI